VHAHYLQGEKMPVLKTTCCWKAVICEVLESVAASFLTLIKHKQFQKPVANDF
jgi:hypothetical protein